MLAPLTALHRNTFGRIDDITEGTFLSTISFLLSAKKGVKENQHTKEHFQIWLFR